MNSVILRCERSEPRRMHGRGARAVALRGPLRGHLRVTDRRLGPALPTAQVRHARPCAGHPRLSLRRGFKTWMAGTSPAMTSKRRVGKGAERRAHVSVNANPKSAVGTLRLAHPTLAVFGAKRKWTGRQSPLIPSLVTRYADIDGPCALGSQQNPLYLCGTLWTSLGGAHEAARVHIACWRCGSHLAACCSRAKA
jgi:hypothetical protein